MVQENNYSDKLKDPRWQKKRLHIFERDNWSCRFCKSTKDTLVVHHMLYFPHIEPWEYEDSYLITLCENCHEYETNSMDIAKTTIIQALRRYFYSHGLLVLGEVISTNLDYYNHNPILSGKYKGCVHITKNKSVSRDEYILQTLKSKTLSNNDINVLCNSTAPNLIRLLYTPKLEVDNG